MRGYPRYVCEAAPHWGPFSIGKSIIFVPGAYKTMHFPYKTYTWATWPPHGAILVVQTFSNSFGPLYSPNSTNCCTKCEDTRGTIATRRPAGAHFPLQNPLFSSLDGTKPCISCTKRTLGPHSPPKGVLWSIQNHAYPVQNVHLDYIGPLRVSPGAYKTMHILYKTYTLIT